ncbi:FkbM family methyltransferase [Nitratidesulfovibrio sp. D1]|uniref:FkbM family methyltransferase n=1 Tax=Nitratidesulfovibrio sp. D1 TaxID=3440151 RepID=UPI003EB6ECF1
MQPAVDTPVQMIEAHLLLGTRVKIDPSATRIGGAWQGKDPATGMPRPWDPETLRFFYEQTGRVKNPVILDIGANTGIYCLLPVLNRTIRGYAFEPNPEAYRILKNNLALNALQSNIQTVPVALSDRKGIAKLKIPASGTDSGLACLGSPQRFDGWHETSVPMDTLDNVAKWKNISRVDLIKIDTEGCELPVLLGGEQLIRSTFPRILLEFEERNTAQFGYHPDEIAELLTSWGYTFRKISSSDAFFYKENRALGRNATNSPSARATTNAGTARNAVGHAGADSHAKPVEDISSCDSISMQAREKTLAINPAPRGRSAMKLRETIPGRTPGRTAQVDATECAAKPPFVHWIKAFSAIHHRLYYRDQSAESLQSLTEVVRRHDPTVIIELGTLSGLSLRTWLLATRTARIHAVDLSFKPLRESSEFFPMDLSRVTLHEQDILTLDFPALWNENDRVLLFVDAHDLPGAPIMEHMLRNALPILPRGSVVVVDDLWHSPERLTHATAQHYFNDVLLSEIDELQCFIGHYAPYRDNGSFMGFLEVVPLLEFVNARGIDLQFAPGGKHVWFEWDGQTHAARCPAPLARDDAEWGAVEYNPLRIDSPHPVVQRVLAAAEQLYRQGRTSDAATLLNDLLKKEPSPEACLALATCFARLGGLIEAHGLVSAAGRLNGSNARIERLRRDLSQRLGMDGLRKTGKKGVTIFAIPKPFTGHAATIQKNAIRSWARLTPPPEIILFGDETGIAEMACEIGARHVPEVTRNEFGTPLVDGLFRAATQLAENDILAYVNADIILFDDFMAGVERVVASHEEFLLVGRRWDLCITEEIDFSASGWRDTLRQTIAADGFLHAETGLDYFVHTRGLWAGMPPFALGRCAWDNWLMKWPVAMGKAAIDATAYITAVHQDHGYAHAGNRANAFTGLEAQRNRAMAGSVLGWTTDAPYHLTPEGMLERRPLCPPCYDSPEAKAARVRWLVVQAGKLITKGHRELATVKYEEATQLQPGNARIGELLAVARMELGATP